MPLGIPSTKPIFQMATNQTNGATSKSRKMKAQPINYIKQRILSFYNFTHALNVGFLFFLSLSSSSLRFCRSYFGKWNGNVYVAKDIALHTAQHSIFLRVCVHVLAWYNIHIQTRKYIRQLLMIFTRDSIFICQCCCLSTSTLPFAPPTRIYINF